MPTSAHLANLAALIVAVSVEGEKSLGPDQVRDLLGIWESVLDPDAVVLLNSIKQSVGLAIQATSVQAV